MVKIIDNNLNEIDVKYIVISPKEKEIQDKQNLILEKLEYLECISKQHKNYHFIMSEIQAIRKQINTLKNQ